MASRILVTGANGFVGRHLLDRLAQEAPDAIVHAWRRPADTIPARPRVEGAPPVEWTDVELLDPDAVVRAVSLARPDEVYHLAGAAHVGHAWQDTATTLEINVYGTHVLLEALRRASPAVRVLIPGSATVYAPSEDALHEDSPIAPSSPYALSKLAQERLGARAVRDDGVRVLLVRAFNHVGPGQDPSFFAPAFARQIARIEARHDEPVLRVGNLEARRDLVDVRDTVRAYTTLMAIGQPGEPYNVCSGQARSVWEVLQSLLAMSRVAVRVETDPSKLRPNDTPIVLGSHGRISRDTGWQPEIPFETTLRDVLDDARARWGRLD